ncbi:unnamed protein product [Polarella glacialis]|uniref:FAD-binding domain-containing protein n=1 Tax=Polarella glacialis TaxID=89957 RepID=A0A813H3W4_POLGL|nr:unnamed protein product [Polarella glacialis]
MDNFCCVWQAQPVPALRLISGGTALLRPPPPAVPFASGSAAFVGASPKPAGRPFRRHRRPPPLSRALGAEGSEGTAGAAASEQGAGLGSCRRAGIRCLQVAVVGAGPVGLLAAIALARRGYKRIRVFDRLAKPPAPDNTAAWGDPDRSYNLGIGGRGQRALTRFGAMERVDQWSKTVVGRKDWSGKEGPPKVTINTRRYLTKVIARDRLSSVLYQELREKYPQVSVDFSVEFLDFVQGDHAAKVGGTRKTLKLQRCVSPSLATETAEEGCEMTTSPFEVEAEFIIGADGIASGVRAALAQMGANIEHQRFEDRKPIVYRVLSIPVPEGERTDLNCSARNGDVIVESLPNVEGTLLGVVLFRPEDERVENLKSGQEAKELFQELFPDWPTPLISDGEWDAFARRRTKKLPQFAFAGPELHLGGDVCLIGDAIHSVKPFFGLGLNSGFEDISVLDQCLEEVLGAEGHLHSATLEQALPQALSLYSKRRAPEARSLVECQRIFDQPTPLRFALAFVLPLVLDSIFHGMLPSIFAPGLLALFQDGEYTFTEARRRKRLDRLGQAVILGVMAVLAVGASVAALRSAFGLVRRLLG